MNVQSATGNSVRHQISKHIVDFTLVINLSHVIYALVVLHNTCILNYTFDCIGMSDHSIVVVERLILVVLG